jgi:hypothetical protein
VRKTLIIIGLAALVSCGLWRFFPSKPATVPAPSAASARSPEAPPDIAATQQFLASNADRTEGVQRLARLKELLKNLSAKEASLAIQRWLDSGADAPTHLGFVLARDGTLREAPSLRTFLLDYLIQIDPAAAAACAEKILRASNSPDEWAIALRAYALANPTDDGKTLLRQKMGELIQNAGWRNDPSAGFLEAFDVIVYSRDEELVPQLGAMVRQQDTPALTHAAYLTVDRLVQSDPAGLLGQFESHPELLEGRENARADFFARADVRDPAQQKILEAYLLDSARTPAELQQFAGVYPNANYMISYNLLTESGAPTGADLAARDAAALKTVQEWLNDPRFAKLNPQLTLILQRLQQFVSVRQP